MEARPLLEKVRSATIVSYEMDGNVSKTVFDNDVVLYVNYGTSAQQTALGTLEAQSFHFN